MPTLSRLLPSFELSLRAANKAEKTIKTYKEAIRLLADFLQQQQYPSDITELERRHIEAFIADQLQRHTAATASNRYKSLQQFFRWCVDEEEITVSPMAKMKPPIIPDEPPRWAITPTTGNVSEQEMPSPEIIAHLTTSATIVRLAHMQRERENAGSVTAQELPLCPSGLVSGSWGGTEQGERHHTFCSMAPQTPASKRQRWPGSRALPDRSHEGAPVSGRSLFCTSSTHPLTRVPTR